MCDHGFYWWFVVCFYPNLFVFPISFPTFIATKRFWYFNGFNRL